MLKKFFAIFAAITFLFAATTPAFAETIRATGYGFGPEGANPNGSFYKSFARQAAKFDAMRQLAEKINEITVQSVLEVKGGKKISDSIISSIDEKSSRLLKNVRQVGEAKFYTEGSILYCEVTMEITKK